MTSLLLFLPIGGHSAITYMCSIGFVSADEYQHLKESTINVLKKDTFRPYYIGEYVSTVFVCLKGS
jgi:hypothetical protein